MATSWQLSDLSDNIDLREDAEGAYQYRNHWSLSRFRKRGPSGTFSSDVGKLVGSISYSIGSVYKLKILSGSNKYLCVHNGFRPAGVPGAEVVTETQVWEHFGAYQDVDFGG